MSLPTFLKNLGHRVGAALLLVGVLVGTPVLLIGLGSPLPARWPSWSRFVTDLRVGFVPSSAAGKVALAAGWMLWAFATYEILAESASWLRNHASRRSSALGPLQPWLANLVAALVLSAPLPVRGLGATPVPSTALTAAIELSSSGATGTLPASEDAGPALPTYIVQPHDTLWGIAQRYLGDPLRWAEIASLNQGRPEGAGAFGDPNWIFPGWVLVLPADATGLDSSLTQAPPAPAGVQQGPTAGPTLQAPPSAAQTPPASSASSDSAPVGDPGPEAPSRSAAPPLRTSPRPTNDEHPHLADQRAFPVAPIGYGIVGAGVIFIVDRLRRARQRTRPRGIRIRLPEGELADLERGLRTGADQSLLSAVDLSLRMFAQLSDCGIRPPPCVIAVRCRPDSLELVMDPASTLGPPPEPFRSASEPNVWVLDRQWLSSLGVERVRELRGGDVSIPALVTLGADGFGTVLVDVERLGALAITGKEAEMVLQGMVVELSTAPWSDGVDVVVAGHRGELQRLDRVRSASSLAALVSEMRQRVESQRRALSDSGMERAADGRKEDGGAGWDPIVVVCLPVAAEAEPAAAELLLEMAGDGGQGLVVLVGSSLPLAARWTAEADGGPITLSAAFSRTDPGREEPLTDIELTPQVVPPDLLQGVDSLIDAASEDTGVAVSIPSDVGRSREGRSATEKPGERGCEVEVRVLGAVEVWGAARPFSRAWSLELVVYLAMHDHGATTDQWSAALWPDRLMAPASLHSTASAARRSLGMSANGTDHLPRAHGRLRLGPGVTSDWARLQRLANSDAPADRIAALELVRGRPFQGLRATDWAVLDGIVASMETVVVDLALRQSEHCLANKDAAGAEWAARQGLRISPYDERLYRQLLRAADVAGHPEGVESTMRELVQLVADDVEPYDSVHPETLELYRALSRRVRASPHA